MRWRVAEPFLRIGEVRGGRCFNRKCLSVDLFLPERWFRSRWQSALEKQDRGNLCDGGQGSESKGAGCHCCGGAMGVLYPLAGGFRKLFLLDPVQAEPNPQRDGDQTQCAAKEDYLNAKSAVGKVFAANHYRHHC